MFKHKPRLLATAVALALFPALSYAAVLEEVRVTAQKREESVQDVGIAISAFTGKQMEQLGYDNAQQVTSMAPGVSTIQPNGEANYALAIRGVASSDFTTNVESPVALYLDEVYISQMSGAGFALFDMERVEILRGPQGTLFGRNATGGLAHFLSKKPTQELDGYLKGTIGDYEQYRVEGAVSGGITDTLAARFSGSYHVSDGYAKNRVTGTDLNNADDQSYRLQFLWNPTDDLEVLLSGRKAEQDIDTGFFEHVTSSVDGKLRPNEFNYVLGYIDNDGDVYKGDYDRDGFNQLDTEGLTLTVKWAVGDINITSITDQSNVYRNYAEDSDSSPAPVFSLILNTGAEQFSQELRFDGEQESFKWVAGLYYLKLDINDNNGAITEPFIRPEYDAIGIPATPGAEAGLLNPYERNLESISAFGQVEVPLTDMLTLIAGARYIEDENDYIYKTKLVEYLNPYANDLDTSSNIANRLTAASYEGNRNDGEWSGRLQLNATPTDDLLLYASYNRGVRGGGYNAPIFPLSPPLAYDDATMSYDPEQLDAYELGFKGTYLDGLMRVNGATYYYDYMDYQAFNIIGIDTLTFNTDATSWGGELEIIASPVNGLDLLIGAAYNDISVEIPGSGEVPSVQSPKWMFNAMARYEWDAFGGTMAVQGDVLYRSQHYFALITVETVEEDGYALFNTSLSYTSGDGAWQGTVFVDNVFDEEYLVQTFDLSGPFGMTEQYYGRPQWWGISLRYNFGS